VYLRLKSAIITGLFEPGTRIVERELTARLKVSRTPIREALQRLEQDQLVLCYPHRGYYVRLPDYEEAQQAYETRRILEAACGELAAQRATGEQIETMRKLVRNGWKMLEVNDYPALLLCNNDLHLLQAQASHNVLLERAFRRIWTYVDLLRGRFWSTTDRPSVGHHEHEAIVNAIAKGDAPLARRLNEQHVERAWGGVAARLRTLQLKEPGSG
jgi:DNA-binding GntR family transcriptional regulator